MGHAASYRDHRADLDALDQGLVVSIFHHFFPAQAGETSKQVELSYHFRVHL
jgi:hypothetical protein